MLKAGVTVSRYDCDPERSIRGNDLFHSIVANRSPPGRHVKVPEDLACAKPIHRPGRCARVVGVPEVHASDVATEQTEAKQLSRCLHPTGPA